MTDATVAAPAGDRASGRVTNDRWYVTTQATEQRFVDGQLITRPTGVAHAKQMGTDRTACGLWAYSWRGLIELTFPMPPGLAPDAETCPACLELVSTER